jgi:hypothetical protein
VSRGLRVRVGAVALIAGLLVLVVPGLLRPADAVPAQDPPQTSTLIPTDALIPLLEPLQPVLEVISPIAWPACANALLVSVLPGAAGVALPPELANVTGPLLVLCGAVPIPETNGRTCQLDAQAQALLAELTKPLLGSGLPVEVAPTKWLTGLLDHIVDLVPVPGVPLGSTVAATLQCQDPAPETSTTLATPPDDTPPASVDLPETPSFADPPTFAELQTLPPVTPAAPAVEPATPVAPVVRLSDQPRFRYPVVMGLPLLFLALLVFFGRSLTRPLDGATDQEGAA